MWRRGLILCERRNGYFHINIKDSGLLEYLRQIGLTLTLMLGLILMLEMSLHLRLGLDRIHGVGILNVRRRMVGFGIHGRTWR